MNEKKATSAPRTGTGNDLPDNKVEEFEKLYKKQLKIPENNTKLEQFLLCPIGILGSGKTTVIKPLAERLGIVRLSGDEIRKLLKENGFNYERIREIAKLLLISCIKEGYSVAIDSDCASPKTQKLIEEIKKEFKVKTIWIHINSPEAFILNKLKNFKHTWLFKDSEQAFENYFARKSLHRNIDFPFLYTFDTSKTNLEEQLDEAEKLIKNTINRF